MTSFLLGRFKLRRMIRRDGSTDPRLAHLGERERHAFAIPSDATLADQRLLTELLTDIRRATLDHGDISRGDLRGWSVLGGVDVSGGFLRYDPLPVAALIDVIDGWTALIDGSLDPDPDEGWWGLGWPGGRCVIERRSSQQEDVPGGVEVRQAVACM